MQVFEPRNESKAANEYRRELGMVKATYRAKAGSMALVALLLPIVFGVMAAEIGLPAKWGVTIGAFFGIIPGFSALFNWLRSL